MLNLLRMDLYRIKRGKSVYVCFGILLSFVIAAFFMIWLMATPQGQQMAVKIGMLTNVNVQAEQGRDLLAQVDTLKALRQLGLNGGTYNLIFGIWVMLFVCGEYQSGFIKNVMALHQNRWNYAASKIFAAGIVDLCYLLLMYAFVLLMDWMFADMIPYADVESIAFYIGWAWLLTTAFSALLIAICIWTRSVAAGTLAAVLLGTGSIVAPLQGILDMFHIGGWLDYSIYMTLGTGPDRYASFADLQVYALGGGFLALYTVLAGLILKRQDI